MRWRGTVLVQAQVLLLDTSIAESGQHRRDRSIGVLKLTIQPLVRSLMVLLLHDILVQFFQQHLLVLTV